jgi:hypothetical protein
MESKRTNLIFALLAVLCLTNLAAAKGLHYVFTSAGNFPGANYTVPFGVNGARIVGYYSTAASLLSRSSLNRSSAIVCQPLHRIFLNYAA